jgi:hypothetical protein
MLIVSLGDFFDDEDEDDDEDEGEDSKIHASIFRQLHNSGNFHFRGLPIFFFQRRLSQTIYKS